MAFEKGALVRVSDSDPSPHHKLDRSKTYVVTGMSKLDGDNEDFVHLEGLEGGYYQYRFELVNKPMPNPLFSLEELTEWPSK